MTNAARAIRTIFLSELAGTAALVAVGLSFVILDSSPSGPVIRMIPDEGWRRPELSSQGGREHD